MTEREKLTEVLSYMRERRYTIGRFIIACLFEPTSGHGSDSFSKSITGFLQTPNTGGAGASVTEILDLLYNHPASQPPNGIRDPGKFARPQMDAWILQKVLESCEKEARVLTSAKGNPLMLPKAQLSWHIINNWSLKSLQFHIETTAPMIWHILTEIAAPKYTKARKEWSGRTRDPALVSLLSTCLFMTEQICSTFYRLHSQLC
jgi:hypothetical protein